MDDQNQFTKQLHAELARNRLLHEVLADDHVLLADAHIRNQCLAILQEKRASRNWWRHAAAAALIVATISFSLLLVPKFKSPITHTATVIAATNLPVFTRFNTQQIAPALQINTSPDSSALNVQRTRDVLTENYSFTVETTAIHAHMQLAGKMPAGVFEAVSTHKYKPFVPPISDDELLATSGILALINSGLGKKHVRFRISTR